MLRQGNVDTGEYYSTTETIKDAQTQSQLGDILCPKR